MKSHKGFTLIEVAISVVMLVVLIAAVYPTYKQHQRTAERQAVQHTLDALGQQARAHYETAGTYASFKPDVPPTAGYAFSTVTTPDSFLIAAVPLNEQRYDRCGELSVNQLGQHHASLGTRQSNSPCW